MIDTAAAYGNEHEVGEGIRRSGIDRREMFVTTKLWISDYGSSRHWSGSMAACGASGLDYVDLFLLHHPVPTDFDATVEAYKALERALGDRRVRAIGVSNFSEGHLESLMARTGVVPALNQVELHPFFTQPALRAFHRTHAIVTQAWSPLGGINVYRPADPNDVRNPLDDPTIVELAERHGKTPAQVVLRWHIEHEISTIPKSVKPHRIEENIDVFDFSLTPDEVAAIDSLDTGVRGGPDPETIDRARFPLTVEN